MRLEQAAEGRGAEIEAPGQFIRTWAGAGCRQGFAGFPDQFLHRPSHHRTAPLRRDHQGQNLQRLDAELELVAQGFPQQQIKSGLIGLDEAWLVTEPQHRLFRLQAGQFRQPAQIIAIRLQPVFLPAGFRIGTVAVPDLGKDHQQIAGPDILEAGRMRFEFSMPPHNVDQLEMRQDPPFLPGEMMVAGMLVARILAVRRHHHMPGCGHIDPPLLRLRADRQIAEVGLFVLDNGRFGSHDGLAGKCKFMAVSSMFMLT